jgi:hypothetical protein
VYGTARTNLLVNVVWVHRVRILGSLLAAMPETFGGPKKRLVPSRIPQTPPFKALIYYTLLSLHLFQLFLAAGDGYKFRSR